MQMTLHQFAEAIAVLVLHVDELDAVAIRANVADHGGEIDLSEAGAHFELYGVANGQFFRRFKIGAAEANGLHAGEARLLSAFDLCPQRRLEGHAGIAARYREARAGGRDCLISGPHPACRRTILDEGECIFRGSAKPRRLGVRKALAAFRELAQKFGGFWAACAPAAISM